MERTSYGWVGREQGEKEPQSSVKDNEGPIALAASEKHLGQGCDHCLGSLKIRQKNIAENLPAE